MGLPKIKKTIKSYVKNEDGKISKQSIIAMGAILGSAALANVKDTVAHGNGHTNNLNIKLLDSTAQGMHYHHASY